MYKNGGIQMVRYLVSMVTSGQSQKTNPLLSITLLNLLLNILNCIKMKRTIKQIPVYLLNPLKALYFQGISPILCSNLMYFPLFLPLRAETSGLYLSECKIFFRRAINPRAYLQSLAERNTPLTQTCGLYSAYFTYSIGFNSYMYFCILFVTSSSLFMESSSSLLTHL